MVKVQIIGLNKDRERVVKKLHELGVLHVEDLTKRVPSELLEKGLEVGKPDEKAGEISELLVKVKGFLANLPKVYDEGDIEKRIEIKKSDFENLIPTTSSFLQQVENEVTPLLKRLEELNEEQKRLEEFETNLKKKMKELLSLARKIERRKRLRKRKDEKLKELVSHLRQELQSLLSVIEEKFEERDFDIKKLSKKVKKKLRSLKNEKKKILKELESLARKYSKKLHKIRILLEIEYQRALIVSKFGVTKRLFLVEGWIPAKFYETTVDELKKVAEIEVIKLDIKNKEDVPVMLDNPQPIKEYETTLKLIGLPKYGDFDPTIFLFFTFPIFYGMMLGDWGYGLIILMAGLYFWKKNVWGLGRLSKLIILPAIWSIIFGFLFGEFFGNLGMELFHWKPLWEDRIESITHLLVFTSLIGVAHLSTGLLIGFIQCLKHRENKHAMEKLGVLGILIGGTIYVLIMMGQLPQSLQFVGLGLLGVGIVVTIVATKGLGFLEIFGIGGNVLSYTRLLAIGVASAGTALATNEMAKTFSSMLGTPGILVAIVVGVGFHFINLLLGILSPTIHGLRLHYVEFFGKFFEGGGKEYRPFKMEIKKYKS
ncbi:MAG: hypothetical protein J7K98_04375 [Candidatus Aenigmarchaeota archaeon]|nr:hypothetical protein [Candidatus Aenigmarchaeota archaeon]